MLDFYGRDLGSRVARKHLGWYLEGRLGGAALRRAADGADRPRRGSRARWRRRWPIAARRAGIGAAA